MTFLAAHWDGLAAADFFTMRASSAACTIPFWTETRMSVARIETIRAPSNGSVVAGGLLDVLHVEGGEGGEQSGWRMRLCVRATISDCGTAGFRGAARLVDH
jgi:hypothetical protein